MSSRSIPIHRMNCESILFPRAIAIDAIYQPFPHSTRLNAFWQIVFINRMVPSPRIERRKDIFPSSPTICAAATQGREICNVTENRSSAVLQSPRFRV